MRGKGNCQCGVNTRAQASCCDADAAMMVNLVVRSKTSQALTQEESGSGRRVGTNWLLFPVERTSAAQMMRRMDARAPQRQ